MYRYSKQLLIRPPIIFGLRLTPFSLGHANVLTAVGHPAFGGESNGRGADFALLLFVCSRPWADATAQIRNGAAVKEMKRIGRRVARSKILDEAIEELRDYLEFFSSAPPRWEKGDTPKGTRAPWPLAIFCALQAKTNLTRTETWDLAVAEALELAAAIGANEGDDSLVSVAEMEIYKKVMGDEQ